jgi:hypothetical protein
MFGTGTGGLGQPWYQSPNFGLWGVDQYIVPSTTEFWVIFDVVFHRNSGATLEEICFDPHDRHGREPIDCSSVVMDPGQTRSVNKVKSMGQKVKVNAVDRVEQWRGIPVGHVSGDSGGLNHCGLNSDN